MSPAELKLELHELIDQIEDEEQLAYLKESGRIFLLQKAPMLTWDKLSPEQQARLEAAVEESKDLSKLKSHEEVMAMNQKWL